MFPNPANIVFSLGINSESQVIHLMGLSGFVGCRFQLQSNISKSSSWVLTSGFPLYMMRSRTSVDITGVTGARTCPVLYRLSAHAKLSSLTQVQGLLRFCPSCSSSAACPPPSTAGVGDIRHQRISLHFLHHWGHPTTRHHPYQGFCFTVFLDSFHRGPGGGLCSVIKWEPSAVGILCSTVPSWQSFTPPWVLFSGKLSSFRPHQALPTSSDVIK